MAPRPIGVVARLTGLSPDTLRIWERRYGFPRAVRVAGRSRAYSDETVAQLRLITRALARGFRPGDVVGKRPEEIAAILAEPAAGEPVGARLRLDALRAGLAQGDATALRLVLDSLIADLGSRRFVKEAGAPVLDTVGEEWAAGRIGPWQEHLFTSTLQRTLNALGSLCAVANGAPRIALATFPGERHTLGLDLLALYLGTVGLQPVLLGAELPPDEIAAAAHALRARAVGVSVSAASEARIATDFVDSLRSKLRPSVELWLGGGGASRLAIRRAGIRTLADWSKLDAHLAEFRARPGTSRPDGRPRSPKTVGRGQAKPRRRAGARAS